MEHLPLFFKILIAIGLGIVYILGFIMAIMAIFIFKAWEWKDRAANYDARASMRYDD